MKITTSYNIRILHTGRREFHNTVEIYTKAVNFLIDVIVQEWDAISELNTKETVSYIEPYIHKTSSNPYPKYDFDSCFYKFPCYLRRSAIAKAKGMVQSYMSNLKNWKSNPFGNQPSLPKAVWETPAFYKNNMHERIDDYTIRLKIYTGKDWVYKTYSLRKTDVDYIKHHCSNKTEMAPVLRRKGRNWELCYAYEESCKLNNIPVQDQTALSVDLGLNHACVCTVMQADGTILGRHFFKASAEQDRLSTALNCIKKAQQHGARKTPRLWAKAKGINKDITNKTAQFIMDIAVLYNVDVIVFEHLNLKGKKHGSKKQKLHMWKAKDVQNIVTIKAHRLAIRISHICARNTSGLAYDGFGRVQRGTYLQNGEVKYNYGICVFQNGKQYNCDLNASYNIGARYFIRELLKSLPETIRLAAQAQVPELTRRSTCTRSSLISLYAVLSA